MGAFLFTSLGKKVGTLLKNAILGSMNKNFLDEKAYWENYTGHEISDEDVFEIQRNLQAFAKVLLSISQELKNKEKGGKYE